MAIAVVGADLEVTVLAGETGVACAHTIIAVLVVTTTTLASLQ
jgi:hypothetical protein